MYTAVAFLGWNYLEAFISNENGYANLNDILKCIWFGFLIMSSLLNIIRLVVLAVMGISGYVKERKHCISKQSVLPRAFRFLLASISCIFLIMCHFFDVRVIIKKLLGNILDTGPKLGSIASEEASDLEMYYCLGRYKHYQSGGRNSRKASIITEVVKHQRQQP